MAQKDYIVTNINTGATLFSGSADAVAFDSGWFVILNDPTDVRFAFSQSYPNLTRVTVSPAGVAYPGDAARGDGPYKVTVDFAGTPATIVMNQVEDVTVATSWLLITKGNHVIAFSSAVIYTAQVGPSDP